MCCSSTSPNDSNHVITFVENYTIVNYRKLLERVEVLFVLYELKSIEKLRVGKLKN
jgi:hypothetical protein